MHQLPAELVLNVIDMLRGLDAVALAGTSRSVREIVVTHEHYAIDCDVNESLNDRKSSIEAWQIFTIRMRRSLELSVPARVNIVMRGRYWNRTQPFSAVGQTARWNAALAVLRDLMQRDLVVAFDTYVGRYAATDLVSILMSPSDRLRVLKFKVCNDDQFDAGSRFVFPAGLLSGSARRLQAVHLRRVTLPQNSVGAFKNVADASMTANALPPLADIATNFPRARRLRIHGRSDETYKSLVQDSPQPLLSMLRELRLDALSPKNVWSHFGQLSQALDFVTPMLATLHLYFNATWGNADTFASAFLPKMLRDRPVRVGASYETKFDRVYIVITTADNRPPREVRLHIAIIRDGLDTLPIFELLESVKDQVVGAVVPFYFEHLIAHIKLAHASSIKEIAVVLSPDEASFALLGRTRLPWLEDSAEDTFEVGGQSLSVRLGGEGNQTVYITRSDVAQMADLDPKAFMQLIVPTLMLISRRPGLKVSRAYLLRCALRHLPPVGALQIELRNVVLMLATQ